MLKKKIKIFSSNTETQIENEYDIWLNDNGYSIIVTQTQLEVQGIGSQKQIFLIVHYEQWEDTYGC